jgi:rubrerythrin
VNDYNFAIGMEHEGEKFYRDQAMKNKDNALYTICISLAEDEKRHAQIIEYKIKQMPYDLGSMDTLEKAKSVFEGLEDFKLPQKETLNQFDFYRMAVDIEQRSIELYTGYKANAQSDKERELLDYLIAQEKQHFETLDEISRMIRQSMELFENAEFGLRPEY